MPARMTPPLTALVPIGGPGMLRGALPAGAAAGLATGAGAAAALGAAGAGAGQDYEPPGSGCQKERGQVLGEREGERLGVAGRREGLDALDAGFLHHELRHRQMAIAVTNPHAPTALRGKVQRAGPVRPR